MTGGATNLTVNGTLEFAGLLATVSGSIPPIVGTTGEIDGTGTFSAAGLVNGGTIDTNAESNDSLEILYTVTNDNVLLADSGNLFIGALASLQNGTLTGGSYIARGFIPTDAASFPLNILAILRDTGLPETSHVTCFTHGARILTQAGYGLIETLRVGDAVVTRDGSVQPVVWIGHRTINCRRHPDPDRVHPVPIAVHAFGENLAERPLLVSPNHALYFDRRPDPGPVAGGRRSGALRTLFDCRILSPEACLARYHLPRRPSGGKLPRLRRPR